MSDVTQILSEIEGGSTASAAKLFPLVYRELRRLAAQKMIGESPDHTLQATALVHEAYLRLVDVDRLQNWDGRGHFFSAAAEAMRRILIESARRKRTMKHGGEAVRGRLGDAEDRQESPVLDLLALDEALAQLESSEPRKAAVVKMRFFSGLTNDEVASALGISVGTAKRDWTYARAWLHSQLGPSKNPPKP